MKILTPRRAAIFAGLAMFALVLSGYPGLKKAIVGAVGTQAFAEMNLAVGGSGSALVGFETGNTMEMASVSAYGGWHLDTTVVRPGSGMFSYCARDISGMGTSAGTVLGGMSTNTVSTRFSYRTSQYDGPRNGAQIIFYWNNPGVPRQPGTCQVYFYLDGVINKLYACSSQVGLNGGAPVYGQTVIVPDTWYTIRVAYDSAPGGVVKLWVDDVLDINTTHGSAGLPITDVRFSGNGYVDMYFDDFWVGDSAEEPPLGQIVRLAPTAGGPISWDNSGGYIRVDEITPLGGANEENIHTGINDATEYYELQDIADLGATINAVKAMWQMKRGPGQDSDHRFAWFQGGFFGDGGSLVLSQKGYATFSRIFETAPSGGPWDVLKLAGFQIGARHVSGPQDTYISWASAMVDYKKSY